MIPVLIPSKGKARPGATPTTDLLKAAGREYTLFVEPQEYEAYRHLHADVVPIVESGRGNGYVRRWIQENYVNPRELEISWILDDDFDDLWYVPPEREVKPIRGGAEVLAKAEESVLTEEFLALEPPVAAVHFAFLGGIGGAEASRDPRPYTFAKIPVMGLLVIWERARAAGAVYEPDLPIHEDVNFAFQLFKAGYTTAQFNWLAQSGAPILSTYVKPAYRSASEWMVKRWGDWCTIVPNPKIYKGFESIPEGERIMLRRNHTRWKRHLKEFGNSERNV